MFTLEYERAIKEGGYMLRIEAMHTKLVNSGKNLEVPGEPDFVEFYSYLEDFAETYNSNWQTENVYGRMDGISNYINTTRQINLSFKIPAADLQQSKENLYKVSKLIRFLYPGVQQISSVLREKQLLVGTGESWNGTVPEVSTNAVNIKTAPILRLRFSNLIQDSLTGGGLYGFIEGAVNVRPMKDAGYFTPITSVPTANGQQDPKDELNPAVSLENQIFPKVIDLSFTFKPLHNHVLGIFGMDEAGTYTQFGQGSAANFPYGVPEAGFEPNQAPFRQAIPFIDYSPDISEFFPTPPEQSLASELDLNPQQESEMRKESYNVRDPNSIESRTLEKIKKLIFF